VKRSRFEPLLEIFRGPRPDARSALMLVGDPGRYVALIISGTGDEPRLEWALGNERRGATLGRMPLAPGPQDLELRIDPVTGALSALYYADRLNQLPIGVIGIAVGTVLLPEMSRRLTANDHDGAMVSQSRAFDFTLLFSVPFVAAFLAVPDVITRAMFARGAFSKADAAAAGATLAAYAVGLIPFVMIRSAVSTFYARKDTATPVKASLTGIAANVLLKIVLMGPLAQVGLALATAVGAWVNLLLVLGFAVRAGYLHFDRALLRSFAKFLLSGVVLGAALWLAARFAAIQFAHLSALRDEAALLLLVVVGMVVYGGSVVLLFGPRWLTGLVRG